MTHTAKDQQFALDYVLRKHGSTADILGEAGFQGGIGAAIGAPIGAVGGAIMDDTPDRHLLTKLLLGGLRGAGVGGAIGAVRGSNQGLMRSMDANFADAARDPASPTSQPADGDKRQSVSPSTSR